MKSEVTQEIRAEGLLKQVLGEAVRRGRGNMTYRVLLDTSVIVGAVLNPPIRYIVEGLGVECVVYYSALYTVADVTGSKLSVDVKKVIEWASKNLVDAGYLTPAGEPRV